MVDSTVPADSTVAAEIPRRLRGAGIWVYDDHVLMESTVGLDLWGVPGGKVEPGEAIFETCVREFREELGLDVRVDRLAIIADCFFKMRAGHLEHDITFYFMVSPIAGYDALPAVASREPQIEFRWIPVADLGKTDLVPDNLDVLIPLAMGSVAPVYVSYDHRREPDMYAGSHIWQPAASAARL